MIEFTETRKRCFYLEPTVNEDNERGWSAGRVIRDGKQDFLLPGDWFPTKHIATLEMFRN